MRFLYLVAITFALCLFGSKCYAVRPVETPAQELAEQQLRGGFGRGFRGGFGGLGLGGLGLGFGGLGLGGVGLGLADPYAGLGLGTGFGSFGAVDPYASLGLLGAGQCQGNAALLFQQQQFQQFQQVPVPVPVPVPVFRPLIRPRFGLGGYGLRRRFFLPRSDERSATEDVTLDRKRHRPRPHH